MRDKEIEQWLNEHNVDYEYKERFPLNKIKIDDVARDNIRLGGIELEYVSRLVAALDDGTVKEFKPLLIYPAGEVHGMLDGMHRVTAYRRRGIGEGPVYIAKVKDPILIEVLQRTANARHGRPPSFDECLVQCERLVALGYSQRDAAKMMSTPEKAVNTYLKTKAVKQDLGRQGFTPSEIGSVKDTSLISIGVLTNPKHRARAFDLCRRARLPTTEMQTLIQECKKERSDEGRDRVLSEWEERYAEQIGRSKEGAVRPPASPLQKLPIRVSSIERVFDEMQKWTARGSDPYSSVLDGELKKIYARFHRLDVEFIHPTLDRLNREIKARGRKKKR